jgi:hypothetical protein
MVPNVGENAAQALERLEIERATGCLTVHGPAGVESRIYMTQGQVFHAEGPAGEGSAVLSQALGWWDATTSFDADAALPTRETIGAPPPAAELPEEWPDEEVPEDEAHFGFDNDVRSPQALLVLVGLLVVVVAAVLILSRKY